MPGQTKDAWISSKNIVASPSSENVKTGQWTVDSMDNADNHIPCPCKYCTQQLSDHNNQTVWVCLEQKCMTFLSFLSHVGCFPDEIRLVITSFYLGVLAQDKILDLVRETSPCVPTSFFSSAPDDTTYTQENPPQIRRIFLPRLFERLIGNPVDYRFVNDVLCSHGQFLDSPVELFAGVMAANQTQSDPKQVRITRLRCLNFVRQWMKLGLTDDLQLCHSVSSYILCFLFVAIRTPFTPINVIPNVFNQLRRHRQKHPFLLKSILPESKETLSIEKFMMLDNTELAQQLCLLDSTLLRQIPNREFWRLNFSRTNQGVWKNSTVYTNQFNKRVLLIKGLILTPSHLQERVKVVVKVIQVIILLWDLNNFSAAMNFVSALEQIDIHRLRWTWKAFRLQYPHLHKQYDSIRTQSDHSMNYQLLRSKMKTVHPPIVPYLGLFMTDLTFIMEGNPPILQPGELLFRQHRMIAKVIDEFRLFLQVPYEFTENLELQGLICSSPKEQDPMIHYNRSIALEHKDGYWEDGIFVEDTF